jgi:predicted CopG family antitoxin
MQKKLTITIDKEVYAGLHTVIGRRNISQFIESLVRPHVLDKDLEAAYEEMAKDEVREAEALEWIEGTIGEISDEKRRSMVGRSKSKDPQ